MEDKYSERSYARKYQRRYACLLPVRKSHSDSLYSRAFNAGPQERLRITVADRDYHYLSQCEIDGAKRISRQ